MNEQILKDALDRTFEEKLLKGIDFDTEISNFEFSEAFNKKVQSLLKNYKKTSFKLTCTRARKIVCILVAILILMLSSLSVSAVRETLANFFVKNFSTHASVNYKEDVTQAKVYPTKIKKVYELSNIPKGYKLVDSSFDESYAAYIYLSDNGQLIFEQCVKSKYVSNIDNKNSVITNEIINNREYLIAKSKNSNDIMLLWDNGEYVFTLTGSLTEEKMLLLCETIK